MNTPVTPSDPSSHLYSPHAHHDAYSASASPATAAAATAAAALSQQQQQQQQHHHLSPPESDAGNPHASLHGRKRKSGAVPGSRGVANLTPEQLAKKRANDREAQRAIRERTRNTIEGLERRIRELEGQQPFQELQRVMQERDRALAECEALRNKLAVVQDVVGGIQPSPQQQQQQQQQSQAQPNLHELANLTAQQSPLPPLHAAQTPQYPSHGAATVGFDQQHLHPELRSPRSISLSSPVNQTMSVAGPTTYPLEGGSLRMDQVGTPPYGPSNSVAYENRLPPPAAMLDPGNGERLDLSYVLEPPRQQHSTPTSPGQLSSAQYDPSSNSDKPLYARMPRYLPPTCPLDALLIDFVASRRKLLSSGIPMRDVIGPTNPIFDGLRDPSAPAHANAHPISALLIEILFKFPGIAGLPEKVAVHYLMFLLLRWMICPCLSCYERMPEWIRPSPSHLDVPKPVWNDHTPWPSMRFHLLAAPAEVKLEDFFIPFTSKLSVNWPYAADDVLIPLAETEGGREDGVGTGGGGKEGSVAASKVKMNPAFESHMRDLRNWSVGTVFQKAFPNLVDANVRVVG